MAARMKQLNLTVGLRDQVLMALALDGQAFQIAEIFEAEFAGAPRQIDGKLRAGVKIMCHGKARSCLGMRCT